MGKSNFFNQLWRIAGPALMKGLIEILMKLLGDCNNETINNNKERRCENEESAAVLRGRDHDGTSA